MNWLDIVILSLLAIGLIKGLVDGMIKQLVALAALIVGIYLCSGVGGWLSGYLTPVEWFPPKAIIPVSCFLGFILIVGVILLAGNIVHRLVSVTPLSIINHLVGGLVGLVLMILFISVLFNILEIVDPGTMVLSQEVKVESRFYDVLRSILPAVFPDDLFQFKK